MVSILFHHLFIMKLFNFSYFSSLLVSCDQCITPLPGHSGRIPIEPKSQRPNRRLDHFAPLCGSPNSLRSSSRTCRTCRPLMHPLLLIRIRGLSKIIPTGRYGRMVRSGLSSQRVRDHASTTLLPLRSVR